MIVSPVSDALFAANAGGSPPDSAGQQDLNGLFHNRLVNATVGRCLSRLLPSAGAMILCGSMVQDATDGYLKPADQAFVASWAATFRKHAAHLYRRAADVQPVRGGAFGICARDAESPSGGVLALLGYWPTLRRAFETRARR